MASIQDVYDQLGSIGTKLNALHTDLGGTITATTTTYVNVDQRLFDLANGLETIHKDLGEDASVNIKDQLGLTVQTLKTGFSALAGGLQVIASQQAQSTSVLVHLVAQMDAVICNLEHINKNTCAISNEVALHSIYLRKLTQDVATLRDIEETVHPHAALDQSRRAQLQFEIEKCCPPKGFEPPCRPEPCAKPGELEIRRIDPDVPPPDWEDR